MFNELAAIGGYSERSKRRHAGETRGGQKVMQDLPTAGFLALVARRGLVQLGLLRYAASPATATAGANFRRRGGDVDKKTHRMRTMGCTARRMASKHDYTGMGSFA